MKQCSWTQSQCQYHTSTDQLEINGKLSYIFQRKSLLCRCCSLMALQFPWEKTLSKKETWDTREIDKKCECEYQYFSKPKNNVSLEWRIKHERNGQLLLPEMCFDRFGLDSVFVLEDICWFPGYLEIFLMLLWNVFGFGHTGRMGT